MVDLARQAFSTNNFTLAAEIYERTIRENGPTSELFLGLADSFARVGHFSKAFNAYTNAYRFGKVTPEKLKHLVVGLINTVKQDLHGSGTHEDKTNNCSMFTCSVCRGLLADPVSLPCGHTFCRKCIEKDKSKTCEICSTVHYGLRLKNISTNILLVKLIEKAFPSQCDATILKKEGNSYFSKGDYKRAIEFYSKAIDIAPTDHLLLSNRCTAFGSLDLFDKALGDADKVIQLRPDWPKGYFRRGTALYGLCKYEDAAVAFLQCLSLDQKVTSAKDYLSKTLDKILSALPPDDPKAHALARECNPTVLQQLVDKNFSNSKPLLLPNIGNTLSNLAEIVKDTITTANQFLETNLEVAAGASSSSCADNNIGKPETLSLAESSEDVINLKQRSTSLPDCSSIDHDEIEKVTRPRTHSILSKNRKRLRQPPQISEPVSPVHSKPIKILKSTSEEGAANSSKSNDKEMLLVEDLECSLCMRLFFQPVTTPCGHSFCRKCLDRCLDHSSNCPMCKGSLVEYLAERRGAVTEAIQNIIDFYFKDESKERMKLHDEELSELARMGSDRQSEVPIFVCILPYPSVSCPLHIFEPRYRLMVRQCMESGTRQFGMCPGTDSSGSYSDYGCMLEIRDVQYFPDGRSVVDTIGGRRFKVVSRGHRDGYDTAKVEFMSDAPIAEEESQDIQDLQLQVYGLVKTVLGKLGNMPQVTQGHGELPTLQRSLPMAGGNGPLWMWWAINVLPLPDKIKLALFCMCSLKDRLIAFKKVLVYMNRTQK